MKHKLNLTSLLLGAALGVIAMLTIAAVSTPTQTSGRFQLLATDVYLFKIDSGSGQVWRTHTHSLSTDFMAPNIPAPVAEK